MISPFPSTRFWFKVHPFQVELIRRSPMNFEEYWAVVFFQNSQYTGRYIHLFAGFRRLVREIFRESSQFWWSHHPSCCSCATRLLVAAIVLSFIHTVKGEEPEQEVGFFQWSCLATFEGWIPIARSKSFETTDANFHGLQSASVSTTDHHRHRNPTGTKWKRTESEATTQQVAIKSIRT